ncbi:MAG: Mur ligase family protein [Thermodesulfovibrionales bacterium]|nr:Mur ligase family protein [Thermodesulfovibrionales bacterium]
MRIFLSGIAGSGMSAIASFLADKGHKVIGSDRVLDKNPKHPLKAIFRNKGIIIVPQDGRGIDYQIDLVVFSTAVEENSPEHVKARTLKLPILTRPEFLIDLIKEFRTVAVSGTSGKSTSTGLLAFLMSELGLDPNFIGGGRVKNFKTSTNLGNAITGRSNLMIIEACESDGTIVNYRPENAILLNIALDHHSIDKTTEMFENFLKNTSSFRIVNNDDHRIRRISVDNLITFSIESDSDYKAEKILKGPFGSSFIVRGVNFNLAIPGKHNIYNSLSSIALLSEMGICLEEIAEILPKFSGIERRFDIHLNTNEYLVIDDYAHNPHKIKALMETVSAIRERVCYIFQPHGYAPTKFMMEEYIKVFTENLRNQDYLFLLPIFYSGGTVTMDVSSEDIVEEIKKKRKNIEVAEREAILKRLNEWNTFVVFGARDDTLSDFTKEIARMLEINN